MKILFNRTLEVDKGDSLIFGQAKIIASKKIYWYFPGKSLKNFKKWLKYFEPNHQSMLISNTLANRFEFQTNLNIISDGSLKRSILNAASQII